LETVYLNISNSLDTLQCWEYKSFGCVVDIYSVLIEGHSGKEDWNIVGAKLEDVYPFYFVRQIRHYAIHSIADVCVGFADIDSFVKGDLNLGVRLKRRRQYSVNARNGAETFLNFSGDLVFGVGGIRVWIGYPDRQRRVLHVIWEKGDGNSKIGYSSYY
jgi:hypothetical protein